MNKVRVNLVLSDEVLKLLNSEGESIAKAINKVLKEWGDEQDGKNNCKNKRKG